jgi:hypothetical protein
MRTVVVPAPDLVAVSRSAEIVKLRERHVASVWHACLTEAMIFDYGMALFRTKAERIAR